MLKRSARFVAFTQDFDLDGHVPGPQPRFSFVPHVKQVSDPRAGHGE